jgi:hypothetical protein
VRHQHPVDGYFFPSHYIVYWRPLLQLKKSAVKFSSFFSSSCFFFFQVSSPWFL